MESASKSRVNAIIRKQLLFVKFFLEENLSDSFRKEKGQGFDALPNMPTLRSSRNRRWRLLQRLVQYAYATETRSAGHQLRDMPPIAISNSSVAGAFIDASSRGPRQAHGQASTIS